MAQPILELVAFFTLRNIAVMHILRPSVLGLKANAGIMRLPFGLLRATPQLGRITEAQNRSSKLSERAIDLIFGALHRQQIYEIQRRAVELLEQLMAATPLGEKTLANLPKDLYAVVCAYLDPSQRLRQLWPDIGVVQFTSGWLNYDTPATEIDKHVHHSVLVLQIVGAPEVDVDVVGLELSAWRSEAGFLRGDHESSAGFAKPDQFGKLRLDYRVRTGAKRLRQEKRQSHHQFGMHAVSNLRFQMHPIELALRVPTPESVLSHVRLTLARADEHQLTLNILTAFAVADDLFSTPIFR
jgi:hypothetical protein